MAPRSRNADPELDNAPAADTTANPVPTGPSNPTIVKEAGQALSPEEDAKGKVETNPDLLVRRVDTILPSAGDRQQVKGREAPEEARAELEYPGTRTGEQGPASDEEGRADKDTSPMPSGGPKDPAVAGGRERRRQIEYRDAAPVVGPDNSAPREERLIPTAVEVRVGPRVLPEVENKPVVVLERSFINNVERVRGDIVSNYTGKIGKNLRVATEEEIAAGQSNV